MDEWSPEICQREQSLRCQYGYVENSGPVDAAVKTGPV